jgi:predicted  nucleic acid-binding Zn-ribbon protein
MYPEIIKLLQVQERDQLIRSFQKELKDIPKYEALAKAKLAGDTAAVESATLKGKEIEVKIKGVELDIQTRQNSIKRLHDQQFETRKNEEFQALGVEVKRYEADISAHEDKQLDLMEELEKAKEVLKAAQAKLAITQGHVNEDLKVLAERGENVKARLEATQAERAVFAEPIDPPTLQLYDRIFLKKGDSAVVPLNVGTCTGCHMKVINSTIQQAKASEVITQCESCGRIIYFVE